MEALATALKGALCVTVLAAIFTRSGDAVLFAVVSSLWRRLRGPAEPSDEGAPEEEPEAEPVDEQPQTWFTLRGIFQALGLASNDAEAETANRAALKRADAHEFEEPVDEQPQTPSWLSVRGILHALGLTWRDAEASSREIYDIIPNHKHKFWSSKVRERGHDAQEPQWSESTRARVGTSQLQPDAKIRRPRISLPIKTHLPVSLRPYGLRALQTTGSVK